VNILNKQSRTVDEGWSSGLVFFFFFFYFKLATPSRSFLRIVAKGLERSPKKGSASWI
jgi:hypothetical protein